MFIAYLHRFPCLRIKERGLPHVHIVLRLENAARVIQAKFVELTAAYEALQNKAGVHVPNLDDAASTWVDTYISAEMPDDPRLPEFFEDYAPLYAESPKFKDDLTYFEGIRNMHVHKHSGNHLVNGCLDKNGVCKKGYSNTVIRQHTTFSKEGFPQYRRRKMEDLFVVPHNRQLFMDWGCGHSNVEFSGQMFTILYLYKYLFKGPSKITVALTETGNDPIRRPILELHKQDEVNRYLRGRRLCSMDAMWRLLGFQTYPASDPAVIGVKIRMPSFVIDYNEKKLLLDIVVYFNRPEWCTRMLFAEFFGQYITRRQQAPSAAFILAHAADDPPVYYHLHTLDGLYGVKPVYVYKRDPSRKVLCRLHTVAHSGGEIWFARLLIKLFPFRSFDDMLTFEDLTYGTFQQAAIARGVANDAADCLTCFTEACLEQDRTPRELRALFVTMATNAFPVFVVYDNELLRASMFEPRWIDRQNPEFTPLAALQHLLCDLRDRFSDLGATMTDHGLPEPEQEDTELQRSLLRYPLQVQVALYQHLLDTTPLNVQQQSAFDLISSAVLSQSKTGQGTFFTLEGSGGTGKTEVAKHLMAFIRSTPVDATGVARRVNSVCSTALGAQNYPRGECTTAHSFFKLPVEQDYDKEVDDDCPMQSHLSSFPERLELIQGADVIFWDEAMANHRECLEAVLAVPELDCFKGILLARMHEYIVEWLFH